MMTAANAEWQRPSMGSAGKGKGGGGMPTGRQPPPSAGAQRAPPPNYVCFRCNTPGHYIQFCPTNGDPKFDQVQRPTGPVALLPPTRNPKRVFEALNPGRVTTLTGTAESYRNARRG